ncbi:MAG: thymidylate kinase [Alphaproteobacteria bacterium]|jgi:dTMP kinase|nr:thymidylate kinase [Alphaproteobacteria bacterium]
MVKGVFITLEGGEGTGKSTQVKMLGAALSAAGVDAVLTREPGGTDQAERIRNLMIQRDAGNFDPLTEAMLMMSARREHLVNKIWPSMEQGKWVVSDRFVDSTRAFQGYGMGLDQALIDRIYAMIAGDFQPDLTFVFDIDAEKGLSRSLKQLAVTADKNESTEDRYERMGVPFHNRLRQGFLEIAKRFRDRCVIIDASQDIATIHGQILKTIETRFGISLREVKLG